MKYSLIYLSLIDILILKTDYRTMIWNLSILLNIMTQNLYNPVIYI